MPKTLKQTHFFDASPQKLFEAFTRSAVHRKFTGTPAKVSAKAGAVFTAYGGYVQGVNLEVRKNASLVQAWRGRDWPEGEFSIVRIQFDRIEKGRTRVLFIQQGIPARNFSSNQKGWENFYWKPLRKWVEATARASKPGAAKPGAPRKKKLSKLTQKVIAFW